MLSNTTINGLVADGVTVRQLESGKRVATIRVAVRDFRLERRGEEVRFIDVDQWDDAADRAATNVVKGQDVVAEGLLDANAFIDKDGHPRVGWQLRAAHVDWRRKPLTELSAELLTGEVQRRRLADQAPAPSA